MEAPEVVSEAELIKLCAVDNDLFCKTFFAKGFRQNSPRYASAVWAALENPEHRMVNARIFRGGFKTTLLRAYAAKRIAYGISRTILYVGSSESHAIRSVQWLRSRIEPRIGADGVARPTEFARTFGLRPGRKWQAHEIEVFHGIDEYPIWVMAVGITGSIRGINFDDYRPDLIILDDCITDENSLTKEQTDKTADLIMGAVANSLASAEEEPNAKLVQLQTPISPHDASARASESSEWHTESFGCWTPETADLPVEEQVSAWEEMFPTRVLRARKLAAIAENRYSIFAREMEVKLVAAESLSFRPNWLRHFDEAPRMGGCVISIDPVPPPSEAAIRKGTKGTGDYEVIAVTARSKGEYYLLDYAISRGHDPNWSIFKLFEFALRYNPLCIVVEDVAYQRTLKWLLEKEMQRRGRYWPTKGTNDRRPKFTRIVTTLAGPASQGKLWCAPHHSEFQLQFENYGLGYRGHDDVLDAVATGISELTSPYLELQAEGISFLDSNVEEFTFKRVCP